MSDVFATIIFVFAIYCAWAIAAYKRPATAPATNPETPIDYFPEVEDDPTPEPRQITIVEPLPTAAFKAPKQSATVPLQQLSIRQLKAMAKERTGTPNAIKGYSRLTKAQLIAALS